jgi:hypothetical protein
MEGLDVSDAVATSPSRSGDSTMEEIRISVKVVRENLL